MPRRSLLVVGLAMAVSLLVGCGEDSGNPVEETTRVVSGAYGEIEIPSDPKRIFADLMTVDYLTALGYDTSRIVGVFGADWFAADENHYLHGAVSREVIDDIDEALTGLAGSRP